MQHFLKLIAGLDTMPLLHAVQTQPELWNAETIRTTYAATPHREADDILLRFNDYGQPGEVVNDIVCTNRPALAALPQARPLIFGLMRQVEAEALGRVIITRLKPGGQIYPHRDGGAPVQYFKRYQIALKSEPGVRFRAGEECVQMLTGDIWWFDNAQEHAVENNSAHDRIAMIVDVRPCR